MRRKALKQKKKLESSPFWNPESTELESGIQYSESRIHRVESRIQDCHGFPYMGRTKKKEEKTFPPRVVEPQTYDVKGQRDIHCATATLNVKMKLYI